MNKFIQFELWKDCSNHCPFCFNRGQVEVNKAQSCRYVLEQLNNIEPNTYDYIGLIGGEFFNGEAKLHMNSFFLILRRIRDLNPKKIYITTSLLYDKHDYLVPILKGIDKVLGCLDKIVLCTSWDKKWRFKTGDDQMTWSHNMLWLKNKFPQVELHTEIILTQPLIDAVNNKQLNFALFKKVFRCSLDFIEPSSGLYFKNKQECQQELDGFFPTKSSFVTFLNNIKDDIDLDNFLSMNYRSNELHYYEDGVLSVAKNRRETAGRCELRDKSRKYEIGFIDSDEPMRDVVLAFKDMVADV